MLVSFFITAFGDTEQKGISTKRPTLKQAIMLQVLWTKRCRARENNSNKSGWSTSIESEMPPTPLRIQTVRE